MSSTNSSGKPVGVLGAGSFGTAIANILAEKNEVLLYSRSAEKIKEIAEKRISQGQSIDQRITPTSDLMYLANSCDIIFPIVPSSAFRDSIRQISPYLHPYHILIHGTKGLDLSGKKIKDNGLPLTKEDIKTMSEVIREESVVVRVGCLAGPNLARELADQQPAATVVASAFDEVIQAGQKLLRTERFLVYGNRDLVGIELTGVLKNIIAIAAGALSGLGLGENAKGLLISRGILEMIHLGKHLGGNVQAFIGLAGIGDLVATCYSTLSRNFTVGYRLSKGESLAQITADMEEVAEGVNTVRIIKQLVEHEDIRAPITETLHKILFEGNKPDEALRNIMRLPFTEDIDFSFEKTP